ncbi:MAG: hypothetical protein JO047_09135 [Alphaproteobacteria bacterium]|nr:hypothetical protein [Alphaproteobacteria bacterium]
MRALVLACSIVLAATLARAQVNGPVTISPHDDTASPPGAASPEPHAAPTPAPSEKEAAPTTAPAPPAPSVAAPPASPAPPSAGQPPAATPAPAPKRQRQAAPERPPGGPDMYGGPPEGPMPQYAPERPHGLRARFEAANVTHDGRLTPEQAMMGGMRGVARHFAEIDRDNRGYVTIQEIRAWRRARRHRNMMPAAPGGPEGAQ